MSDVFDTCEANFLKDIRFVQKSLQETETNTSKMDEITQALSDANQQLSKMEIEFGMCHNFEMKVKINLYKEQLRSYKRKTHEKQQSIKQKQEQMSDEMFEKEEQVGVDPLLEAKRQMYQNEACSNEVALGIKNNNEKLIKNINRMGDINNQLTVAQKLLGSIKMKMAKNKYTLWATLFILFLVVVFVIYTYVA